MAAMRTKAGVIEHLVRKLKLPKKKVAEVYDELLAAAAREAKRGILLPGFAKLVSVAQATPGVQPRVGEQAIRVPTVKVARKAKAPTQKDIRPAFEAWRKDQAKRHLSLFLAGLKNLSPDIREAAMYALSAMGPTATPELVNAVKDEATVWPALRLLRDLADPETRTSVTELLSHQDHSIRQLAFRTLLAVERQRPPEEAWTRQITTAGRVPSLTTIIHGTWAEDAEWWRWPAEFPRYLDSLTGDFYKGMDPFQWPGDNSPEAREKGARDLISWLGAHPAERVTLIAHSHGGNVVFKTTELGERGEIYIARLILLGTPIRDDYFPDLDKAGQIIDVYSEDDDVQWWGTWTPDLERHIRNGGRTLPEGPQIRNRQATTRTDNPHFELHTAELWEREGLGSLLTSA